MMPLFFMANRPDRLVNFAKLQANRNLKRWADRQLQTRKIQQQVVESSGNYLGYDADKEAHQIRLLSGKVVDAEALTNAGLDVGDAVAVSKGGGYRFKSMPR